MTNDSITSTRATLIKDTDHLKHDAGKIVEDVKKHASAHVDAVKEKATTAFDLTREYVREHPFHFATGALLVGFLLGSLRRR
jgi:ElaB/YqjD/DUF883 family membrane-anchored ribosome-binding protein